MISWTFSWISSMSQLLRTSGTTPLQLSRFLFFLLLSTIVGTLLLIIKFNSYDTSASLSGSSCSCFVSFVSISTLFPPIPASAPTSIVLLREYHLWLLSMAMGVMSYLSPSLPSHNLCGSPP